MEISTLSSAGVVELDERVCRVGRRTGANAKLVDLDRADVPHLLGRCLGLLPAAGRVRPRRVADQVAVEGRRPGGDLECRAHARTRRDRLSERLRRLRAARNDGSPLLAGHGNAQLNARRGRSRGVRECHGGVLRRPRCERLQSRRSRSCRRRRQAQPRHVVPRSHNVGLHQLVGGIRRERARGRHRAFIERALRADAVVAAVAQQDRPLLAHRVIGGVDARSVEHDRQSALLRVAAHGCPMVRFALGHCGYEIAR